MTTPQYLTKRALDYVVAIAGLAIAGPAMGLIAVAIAMESSGGALFTQTRLGRRGQPFELFKFRTMRHAPIRYNSDGSTRVDVNDDRITRVGRLLRGGLDELPQLINVVRGEMSIVGPRPDMASQRALYSPGDERKLAVLPGLTSLAVVHGRNDLPWKQRIELDAYYIEHWSLMLDLKIVIETLSMAFGIRAFNFGVGVGR